MSKVEEKEKKPLVKRPSLKTEEINSQTNPNLINSKDKRNSVSWGNCNNFEFKSKNAMFQEGEKTSIPTKKAEEKHKEFTENRKKSIRDEFSLVKEMMKIKNLNEEDDIDEEVKKNTDKNIK